MAWKCAETDIIPETRTCVPGIAKAMEIGLLTTSGPDVA